MQVCTSIGQEDNSTTKQNLILWKFFFWDLKKNLLDKYLCVIFFFSKYYKEANIYLSAS